jgi:DNA-3-methyladenine glycosylase
MTKEVHTTHKKKAINNSWYKNPFPQLMLLNELMCPEIGLYGNYNFFKQMGVFLKHKFNSFSTQIIMQNKDQQNQRILPLSFYTRKDVLLIAKELLGKLLITRINHILTTARIVETEAYNGIADQASHAFGGRKTSRTRVMYANGGTAYVYLCYGMHHLFNVVTNEDGIPHAVLIRAAEPVTGIEEMLRRTNKTKLDFTLTKGPGNVSKALGITTQLTGSGLLEDTICIVDDGYKLKEDSIISTPRIGVDYAGEDAVLPYRFIVKDNPYVSGKKNKQF